MTAIRLGMRAIIPVVPSGGPADRTLTGEGWRMLELRHSLRFTVPATRPAFPMSARLAGLTPMHAGCMIMQLCAWFRMTTQAPHAEPFPAHGSSDRPRPRIAGGTGADRCRLTPGFSPEISNYRSVINPQAASTSSDKRSTTVRAHPNVTTPTARAAGLADLQILVDTGSTTRAGSSPSRRGPSRPPESPD
jgi:hypothetical protein